MVFGEDPQGISLPLGGLDNGTTYHYRVVATNAGGTSVSGTQTFRTLTDPVPSIGGSFFLSNTSARVEGVVDPEGSGATVSFEWGTDGSNFPFSVSAGTLTGNGSQAVSAVLTNLQQGITYHYRLRATSAATTGGGVVSDPATFSMNVLSGFDRALPGPPPESEGFLNVNLLPSGILHGWRFVGEQDWRDPRIQARGLVTGRYEIEFRPVPGYITPPPLRDDSANEDFRAVEVVSGAPPTVVEATYFRSEAVGSGGLSVSLAPDSVASGEGRAQWRLLGEGDNAWRDSGATVGGLLPGSYVIELRPVAGRSTPSNVSVPVLQGQIAARTVTYFAEQGTGGTAPAPLAFETVASADEGNPFAFVGQIRSRSGFGTGFVVKPRVVATAAHVVWDEGTLSGVEGLQWFHRLHRGVHEPPPHAPRGFFILTGYDEARRLEGNPGSFAPQSRNRDIAALYFVDRDAAGGGYGGFLASDLEQNEFLLSNASKIFAAYPVVGVAPASRGLMHATAPSNLSFDPAQFSPLEVPVDPAALGGPRVPEGRRLFVTSNIRSSGGASGGPLLVQFEGGAFYPAAVYLGGTSQMFVRSIDSAAVELFNRAEEAGLEDNGNTGGGITHTGLTPIGGAGLPGVLRVSLAPASAVSAGAGWRLRPETIYRAGGTQRAGLNAGRYRLELKSIPGFQVPAPQTVELAGGQLTAITYTYSPEGPNRPSIALRGRARPIANGSATPSALDGTDFGLVAVDGGSSTRSFVVSNVGKAPLSLSSVEIDGAHRGDFSVALPPASSVPPGGSTSFTVLFAPSGAGTRSATLSFATNVAGATPFSFAIQGNDTTDTSGNGFSDVEERALDALRGPFVVGQRLDLDLSFLRLEGGLSTLITGLPPGLVFDPATMRIAGTVLGKPAVSGHELRKMDGAAAAASYGFDLRVLLAARIDLAGPRPFPATALGRASRPQAVRLSNGGEAALLRLAARTSGAAARDFQVSRPPATLAPGASSALRVTFRPRAKGTRRARLTATGSAAPRSVPLTGRGR